VIWPLKEWMEKRVDSFIANALFKILKEASASSRFRFRAENSFATTDTYSQKYPIGTPTSGVLYILQYDTTEEAATSLLCFIRGSNTRNT